MFAGRGTSDNAALYGKYLTEIKLNLPAGQISASALTAFGARPNYKDVLVIVISQSGGSPDLIETAQVAKQCGALVLAITNTPSSELALAADLHLDVKAGPEIAVAATKSFSAQMLTLWLLISAIKGASTSASDRLEDLAYETLNRSAELEGLAHKLASAKNLVITGRGYSYPVALEAALKIMETSCIHSHGFSSADLVHGPLAMIGPDDPVIVIAPDGKGFQALRPALEQLVKTTSNLIVFGGREAKGLSKLEFINLNSCDEELTPLLDIIALQTAIVKLAIIRGNDPDNPRGLSKVTKTW